MTTECFHRVRCTEPAAEVGTVTGRIRPVQREDIPGVVALRQHVFRFSERKTPEALAAYLETVFFRNPWVGCELPSWVYEDETGRIAGFLGVLPRRMSFRGELLRVAVGTQLMVAPGSRGLIGRRLVRAFISGPQDLTLSDAANDAARTIWESVGGHVSVLHSLHWARTLRRLQYAALRQGGDGLLRRAAFVARRVGGIAEGLVARLPGDPRRPRPVEGAQETLTPAAILARWHDVVGQRALRPVYEDGSLGWLLSQAAQKRSLGTLQQILLRSAAGDVLGWFIYFSCPGGVSEVVQLAARRGAQTCVLAHLFWHAWHNGAVAVAGRLEASWVRELAEQGCAFTREGPWMLVHARRPEILQAIVGGDAFLSPLEGEWWMSF